MSQLWVWCPLHQNFSNAMMVSTDDPRAAVLNWAKAYTIHHSQTVYSVHVEPYPNPERKLVHRFEVHAVSMRRLPEPNYFITELKPATNSHEWDPGPPDEYVRWKRLEEKGV